LPQPGVKVPNGEGNELVAQAPEELRVWKFLADSGGGLD
jgi:hypothetical protein